MKDHDYTNRYWGHDFMINKVEAGGQKLDMMGWGSGISAGDFLILPNGKRSTRYRVESIEYYRDPPDMWKAVAVFAPREVEAVQGVNQ